MKETPMLFCGQMVRATLEDRKGVTRRLVKPQPGPYWEDRIACGPYHPTRIERRTGEEYPGDEVFGFADEIEGWVFPYGRPGDHLWGKETWQAIHVHLDPETGHGDDISWPAKTPEHNDDDYWAIAYSASHIPKECREDRGFPWRPSIFMPRWASRITLEILPGVRAERLQLITPEDCIDEGITPSSWGKPVNIKCIGCGREFVGVIRNCSNDNYCLHPCRPNTSTSENSHEQDLINEYRRLWNSLNLEPKPIKSGGKIVRYESFPWNEADFMEYFKRKPTFKNGSCVVGMWNGLPLHVYPNPYVWRIPFRRIATDKK